MTIRLAISLVSHWWTEVRKKRSFKLKIQLSKPLLRFAYLFARSYALTVALQADSVASYIALELTQSSLLDTEQAVLDYYAESPRKDQNSKSQLIAVLRRSTNWRKLLQIQGIPQFLQLSIHWLRFMGTLLALNFQFCVAGSYREACSSFNSWAWILQVSQSACFG